MEDEGQADQVSGNEQGSGFDMKQELDNMLTTVKRVITDPAGFFKDMPKEGGFQQPLIFLVGIALVTAMVNIVLSVFGLGMTGSFVRSLATIIGFPIGFAIFGFIGAAVMFLIWKLMGSNESYETAYRCTVYAAAIAPISQIIGVVPYLGGPAGMAWSFFLIVLASIHVHKIKPKIAWLVFGILFAVTVLGRLSAENRARNFARGMGSYAEEFGDVEEMTAEEAGKAAARFLKAFQQEAQQTNN